MTFQFETLSDFLTMAGHGSYVWASYLITLIALLIIAIIPLVQQKNIAKLIKRQQRIESASHQNVNRGE